MRICHSPWIPAFAGMTINLPPPPATLLLKTYHPSPPVHSHLAVRSETNCVHIYAFSVLRHGHESSPVSYHQSQLTHTHRYDQNNQNTDISRNPQDGKSPAIGIQAHPRFHTPLLLPPLAFCNVHKVSVSIAALRRLLNSTLTRKVPLPYHLNA